VLGGAHPCPNAFPVWIVTCIAIVAVQVWPIQRSGGVSHTETASAKKGLGKEKPM